MLHLATPLLKASALNVYLASLSGEAPSLRQLQSEKFNDYLNAVNVSPIVLSLICVLLNYLYTQANIY